MAWVRLKTDPNPILTRLGVLVRNSPMRSVFAAGCLFFRGKAFRLLRSCRECSFFLPKSFPILAVRLVSVGASTNSPKNIGVGVGRFFTGVACDTDNIFGSPLLTYAYSLPRLPQGMRKTSRFPHCVCASSSQATDNCSMSRMPVMMRDHSEKLPFVLPRGAPALIQSWMMANKAFWHFAWFSLFGHPQI